MDELRILTRGGCRYELRLGNMILNFQNHARVARGGRLMRIGWYGYEKM